VAVALAPRFAVAATDPGQAPSVGAIPTRDEASRTAGARPTWFSLGLLTGSTQADGALADYQWVTTRRAAWGAEALIGRGRFATGLRAWRAQTVQRIGGTTSSGDPSVRWTSLSLVGEARVATLWGNQIRGLASGGRVHLGYRPDQVMVDVGAGSPIVVDLKPIDEWIAGGGVGVRRTVGERWSFGLEVERRIFGLDTAHRNGTEIEVGRQSFGDWSARLELARLYRRR
jgi:hypothetical protein